jgi:hypothetical protein
MSDNHLIAAPVAQPTLVGETLPVPTPEQEQAADRLFAPAEEHHAAADLLGMVAATQLLQDLAIETFRRSERRNNEAEELELNAGPDAEGE